MQVIKEWDFNGIKIQVALCDITRDDSEVIVNAANSSLKHGGGVALAIARAGGPRIQEESDEYTRKYGPVPTGQVAVTSGGNLKAKYVIHAVGPIWRGGKNREDELLFEAVYNSLKKANELGASSIAMPAISTGIYGFPKERAARIFGKAIGRFIEDFKDTKIKTIKICHIDGKNAKIFAEHMEI